MKKFTNILKEFILNKKSFNKKRILMIVVYTILFFIVSLFYKGLVYDNIGYTDDRIKNIITSEVLNQNIIIKHDNIKEVCIEVGGNLSKKNQEFIVNVINNSEIISTVTIDAAELEEEQLISIILPEKIVKKGDNLSVQIIGNAETKEDGLSIYGFKSENNHYSVNNINTENTIKMRIAYPRFSGNYLSFLMIVYLVGVYLILKISVKKIHNTVFLIILFVGMLNIIFNPILDTPDDHAHLCRSELTSRGILFLGNNSSEYKISKSVDELLNNNYSTIDNVKLNNNEGNWDFDYQYANYANSNIFIGYIPQAIGILIAKVLGLGSIFILLFGKSLNLIFYAVLVRYAIKLAPAFKMPISIISIMPMSIFIASSFNPDTTTYAMAILLISYLLRLNHYGNITRKKIIIFTTLSIMLGLVKLPYCILGGLIIFIPAKKFINKRTYYESFLYVACVALVSLGWGISTLIGSTGDSPFNEFHQINNINTVEQIKYILSNPISFTKTFLVALIESLQTYYTQLNTFGWLSYAITPGLQFMYTLFIGSVIFLYPYKEAISLKLKSGIGIVASGTYFVTNLILYLSWTPVGHTGINGVQGRYLIPIIILISLLSFNKSNNYEEERETLDEKYIFIALMFSLLLIITVLNRYY